MTVPPLHRLGLGLPCLPSLSAAANFCVARRVAELCLPGMRWQLPLVPGFLPGVGSKPGQQFLFLLVPVTFFSAVVFFAVDISD